MNHIELFAGCGGLSLGLEQLGFELVMANELSPMAAETFAYNFFGEDLEEKANQKENPENVFWLNSRFDSLKLRLRENPLEFPEFGSDGFSDIHLSDWHELDGKLIVGSISEFNKLLDKSPELVQKLRSAFGRVGGLDLVSGGPPCQGFSMSGKREKDSDKNQMPWEFAKFVDHTRPKVALLENVTGILRAFQNSEGEEFHAWYEVAKVFATIGYVPLCLHLNARQVGVPQNRPRFIMVALRSDHLESILEKLCQPSKEIFIQPLAFFHQVQVKRGKLEFGYLDVIDSNNPNGLEIFQDTFLAPLVNALKDVPVRDALDDLKFNSQEPVSEFIEQLNSTFTMLGERRSISAPEDYVQWPLNHEPRNHSPLVQRRFRLHQILQIIGDRKITHAVFGLLKGEVEELSPQDWMILKEYRYLHEDGELYQFSVKEEFERYLRAHPTKKHTQKALIAKEPAPAALSIPDDACHYDEHELRVLTVREMARIQSFPDNFVFRSKITTGGQMRKFEVPQYTQVGNAVPPLLGIALARVITGLLD